MRKIIYTVSVNPGNCFKKCVQSQKEYAERINADFLVRSSWQNWNKDLQTDSEKGYIVKLLKHYDYDRVLYLDADVYIKDDAPDIFKEYENTNDLVIYNEVMYNDIAMDMHIVYVANQHNINWHKTNGHYDWLNAGVMLCSKGCEKVFDYNHDDFFKFKDMPMIYDMPYMHYNIYKNNIPITFLDEKFNTMVYFHSNGYFLHFANVFDRDEKINEYV